MGFPPIAEIVAKQMSRCLQSPHFQIAQRTVQMFDNPTVLELIKDNASTMYPILIPALSNNLCGHWNKLVSDINFNAIQQLKGIDRRAYDLWVRGDRDGPHGKNIEDHHLALEQYDERKDSEANR